MPPLTLARVIGLIVFIVALVLALVGRMDVLPAALFAALGLAFVVP